MLKKFKERNRLWLKALRSKKYEQFQGGLRNKANGRCCLGVACEVFHEQTGEGEWLSDGSFMVAEAMDSGNPPHAVVDWFGWDSNDPSVKAGWDMSAVEANDQEGWSFKQIADAFEKLHGLKEKKEPKPKPKAKGKKAKKAKRAR